MDSVKALVNIINTGIGDIESIYNKEGTALPSLDDVYTGPSPAAIKSAEATNNVVSAALQLIATLQDPALTCLLTSGLVSQVHLPPPKHHG
jgi:hypothetical protein